MDSSFIGKRITELRMKRAHRNIKCPTILYPRYLVWTLAAISGRIFRNY